MGYILFYETKQFNILVFINDSPITFGISQDELLWAALWLERATGEKRYLDFINTSTNSGGTRTEFSWDDKYVGVQLLIAKVYESNERVVYSHYWTAFVDTFFENMTRNDRKMNFFRKNPTETRLHYTC